MPNARRRALTPPDAPPPIVIVDDDSALLRALSFAFETDGFRVVAFPDAESALAHPPTNGACFVVDQLLPGMSGLDLLEALRARGEGIPAVLITTHPSAATRARAHSAGVDIIEKPLLSDALAARVRGLTG